MAQMLRGKLMFDPGDRVGIGDGEFGYVVGDQGGAVVKVRPEGARGRYPHDAESVPRGSVTLARQIMDMDNIQVEIYSGGSTHTLYECCGFEDCRKRILHDGLGVPEGEVFERDQFFTESEGEPVRITVADLDESDSCVWCYGCGDFIRHADASREPDGSFAGCSCEDPENDREPLRPMVVENGRLELRHWGADTSK